MKVMETPLQGVTLIALSTDFKDHRGRYRELYNRKLYDQVGCPEFVADDISSSHKDVLRGIHGDNQTWKLISCLQGAFFLVVVNFDSASPDYMKWISLTMNTHEARPSWLNKPLGSVQVLVPPKYGNGHLVLSREAIFHYKQSQYYDREGQFIIPWNDPRLNIPWPIDSEPILSQRDGG